MDETLKLVLEQFPYAQVPEYERAQVEQTLRRIHDVHTHYLQDAPIFDPDDALDEVLDALMPSEDDEMLVARIADIYQAMLDL